MGDAPAVVLPPHQPVLCDAVIAALVTDAATPTRPRRLIDATFGRGGHTAALLAALAPDDQLLALDRDPDAIRYGLAHFHDPRLTLMHGPFDQLAHHLSRQGWPAVDGILVDLGVSSPQLDTAARGFSFQQDGPLDMRMDPTQGQPVSDWLATATAQDIAHVLWRYGEERLSRPIARQLVAAREIDPLTRTRQLADLIAQAAPSRHRHKHPATRSFQALRIFINDELGQLERLLPQALAALAPGGRLAVLSFHSLEDRLVKRFFQDAAHGPALPLDLPVTGEVALGPLRLLPKQAAGDAELQQNPRSRSAWLRVAERRPFLPPSAEFIP